MQRALHPARLALASAEVCRVRAVTPATLLHMRLTGPGVKRSITGAAVGASVVGEDVEGVRLGGVLDGTLVGAGVP